MTVMSMPSASSRARYRDISGVLRVYSRVRVAYVLFTFTEVHQHRLMKSVSFHGLRMFKSAACLRRPITDCGFHRCFILLERSVQHNSSFPVHPSVCNQHAVGEVGSAYNISEEPSFLFNYYIGCTMRHYVASPEFEYGFALLKIVGSSDGECVVIRSWQIVLIN